MFQTVIVCIYLIVLAVASLLIPLAPTEGQTDPAVPVEQIETAGQRQGFPSQETRPSKLGIHGILADDIIRLVRRAVEDGAHFSVVKAVDDLGYLKEVKAISPDTVTVARLTFPQESADLVNDPTTDLTWYAGEIMSIIFDRIEQDPDLVEVVDYWEPINEPLGGGVPTEAYERLAYLMIACMELAEARGLRLAMFSFSAGTPEWADMAAIVETGVFGRAKAGGHILALHEGVFGDAPIDQWYGSEHTIPGAPVLPDTGSLCGRYRYWYHLLQARNEVVPLFISEFYAGGGYGVEANTDDIVARMAWYDDQLQQNSYALGFAPFTLGPVEQWVDQDYGFAYPALMFRLMGVLPEEHRVFLPITIRSNPRGPAATAGPFPTDNPPGATSELEPSLTPDATIEVMGVGERVTASSSSPEPAASPLAIPLSPSEEQGAETPSQTRLGQNVLFLLAGTALGLGGGWVLFQLVQRRRA